MALTVYRILYKYARCLVVTALLAFFIQIIITVRLFPSDDDNVLLKNGKSTFTYRDVDDVSARRINNGFDDDEDLSIKKKVKPVSNLRLEELDFKPVCDLKSKEAISAVHRAKTQSCKQQLVNKSCLIQNGKFYPVQLPNYCLGEGMTYGKYLGCYQDEKKLRILSSFYGNFAKTNSHSTCLDICVQAGLPYAGVQYASECFCGENAPPSSAKILDEFCDMICPANETQKCGGYFTMNIFETGLSRFAPKAARSANGRQDSIRILFLLTLNGRAVRQVHRLINSLYRNNHYYLIHVDARQDYLHRKLSALEKKFDNIKFASERFSTIWGGASLLKMLLSSMKQSFKLGWQWDFVINLSESDFPIKSLENLEGFLIANKGFNFVKSHGREVQRFIKKQGLDKTFIECEAHMWRVGDRKLPRGITIDGGSDWIALSSEFVAYVVGEQDDLLTGLDVVFQHTLLPAESYFHTVLRNSHFCNTYVDNNLHVTNWKRKLGCKCQYKHVVDWCGCSPNDFRTEDWPRIQGTQDRQLFFARKFEPIINQEIITRVEQYIGYDDHYLIPAVESYWQNIYDVKDLTASTDDLLLTHARSIVRHNAKILLEQNCIFETSEIIEINSYHFADVYKGNLIMHRAVIHNNVEIVLETWYKPQKNIELSKANLYLDVIRIFKVGSDYDQKEITFRNLGNILGPLSELVLLYQLSPYIDKQIANLTVMWLDPTGMMADVIDIHVDENNLTNFIKPNLKLPLLPGIWKVGLFHDFHKIAVTKFLITPLEYFSGKKLSHQEAKIIHSGSQHAYTNFSHIIKHTEFLPNHEESELLLKLSNFNIQRINEDLREWIDNLNIDFYNLLGSCVKKSSISENIRCGKHTFEYCNLVEWSSLSPDPKGVIGKLNKETGRLDRV